MEHISELCGHNAEYCIAEAGAACKNYWAVKHNVNKGQYESLNVQRV